MKPDNAVEGAELQNMLVGLQKMQTATGAPEAGVIDGLRQNLNIQDPKPEVQAPQMRQEFDIKF